MQDRWLRNDFLWCFSILAYLEETSGPGSFCLMKQNFTPVWVHDSSLYLNEFRARCQPFCINLYVWKLMGLCRLSYSFDYMLLHVLSFAITSNSRASCQSLGSLAILWSVAGLWGPWVQTDAFPLVLQTTCLPGMVSCLFLVFCNFILVGSCPRPFLAHSKP